MISPFILGVVMGKLTVLLLILLGFLQYSLWLGKNGSELGMIKPNESFYRIVNDKSQPRR